LAVESKKKLAAPEGPVGCIPPCGNRGRPANERPGKIAAQLERLPRGLFSVLPAPEGAEMRDLLLRKGDAAAAAFADSASSLPPQLTADRLVLPRSGPSLLRDFQNMEESMKWRWTSPM